MEELYFAIIFLTVVFLYGWLSFRKRKKKFGRFI